MPPAQLVRRSRIVLCVMSQPLPQVPFAQFDTPWRGRCIVLRVTETSSAPRLKTGKATPSKVKPSTVAPLPAPPPGKRKPALPRSLTAGPSTIVTQPSARRTTAFVTVAPVRRPGRTRRTSPSLTRLLSIAAWRVGKRPGTRHSVAPALPPRSRASAVVAVRTRPVFMGHLLSGWAHHPPGAGGDSMLFAPASAAGELFVQGAKVGAGRREAAASMSRASREAETLGGGGPRARARPAAPAGTRRRGAARCGGGSRGRRSACGPGVRPARRRGRMGVQRSAPAVRAGERVGAEHSREDRANGHGPNGSLRVTLRGLRPRETTTGSLAIRSEGAIVRLARLPRRG